MKRNPDLGVKMLSCVEVSGFEVGAQSFDEVLIDIGFLFEKQVTIPLLDGAVGFEPIVQRIGRWRARVHCPNLSERTRHRHPGLMRSANR